MKSVPFFKQIIVVIILILAVAALELFIISTNANDTFDRLDTHLLLVLNGYHSGWSGWLLDTITSPYAWPVLTLLLAGCWFRIYGTVKSDCLITGIAAAAITYILAIYLVKPIFGRLSPGLHLGEQLSLSVADQADMYSFVSASTAAIFALSLFISLLADQRSRWLKALLWFYLLLTVADRACSGLHYPGDVLGGILFGGTVGYFFYLIYAVLNDLIPFE